MEGSTIPQTGLMVLVTNRHHIPWVNQVWLGARIGAAFTVYSGSPLAIDLPPGC